MPGVKDGLHHRPVVGVMGSGSENDEEWAHPLGAVIAGLGAHLLTGGGQGVMQCVAAGFVGVAERDGLSLGVLPGETSGGEYQAPAGYPNPFVELAIRTHLPGRGIEGEALSSRNAINVLSADALVILPGGEGTRSEARLAKRFGKPTISYGADFPGTDRAETLEEVEAFLRRALKERCQGP